MKKRTLALFMAACLVCTSISVSAAEEAAFSVSGMTTDYLQNPIGIEADSVHFGWQMNSGIIGKMQSAYRIQVYRAGDAETVWTAVKWKAAIPWESLTEERRPLRRARHISGPLRSGMKTEFPQLQIWELLRPALQIRIHGRTQSLSV